MVVVGVLVADADDAETSYRSASVVRPTLELDFDLHIDVRPREVIENLSELLCPLKGMARPRHSRNSTVITSLRSV